MATDEDALTCDFAETYHVYDFRALPAETAAALAAGLPKDSRVLRRLSGSELTLTETLLAAGVDLLHLILWTKTKDAEKGRNRPQSILTTLTGGARKKGQSVRGFDTPEEFLNAYKRALEEVKHGDRTR